jgi:CubicO group peptidase (beta-lactamase class C family)
MSTSFFAYEHLFRPLGITNVVWGIEPRGINLGYTDVYMRPHDMAKIGQLYLNQGLWNGQQIVSAEWVAKSTREQIYAGRGAGGVGDAELYGYQWWVEPKGYYFAAGHGAQFIYVVPQHNMVVVFTAELYDDDQAIPGRLLNDYIIPAAGSPYLPADYRDAYSGCRVLDSHIAPCHTNDTSAHALPDPNTNSHD